MTSSRRLSVVLVLALLFPGASCLRQPDGRTRPGLGLSPCRVPGVTGPADCGTFDVPENRQRPNRTIALRIVLVRARATVADRAVFVLTGGPGSAATDSAGPLTRQLAALSNTHDFVFVDQRGTGGSHPLACVEPDGGALEPMFGADMAARCRDALQASADLTAYTTADAVADLEAVRAALGYERIDLHGSSYGTRLAWAFAAAHPDRARTLFLHGPAPPGLIIPLPFAQGLDLAVDGLVDDCLADEACATRFPDLKADVARAFEQLRAGPVVVSLTNGRDVLFSQGELAEAVRYLLYSPTDARRVPLLLAQAGDGDYGPIARALEDYRRGLQRVVNKGLYLSVTCAEDIPLLTQPSAEQAWRGTRLGDYRVRQQIAACSEWPRGPAGFDRAASPSAVPALLLVGAFDPATPLASARQGAALLSEGRLVVVPHGGHTFNGLGIDDCIQRITTAFIRDGSSRAVDHACVGQATRPPFLLQ